MVEEINIPAQESGVVPPSQPAAGEEQRPGWLAEKFETPEDLQRAYNELEAKMSGSEPPPEESPADPPKESETPEPSDGLEIPKQPEQHALEKFEAEFSEKGELSEKSYNELAKLGYPKHIVDQYIAGAEALQQQTAGQVMAIVGGEEGYAQMMEWASRSLDEDAQNAYNAAVSSGDMSRVKLAVQGLAAQFQAAGGKPGSRIEGAPAGLQPFRSMQELQAAQRDPRYGHDPAYTQDVYDRVAASGDMINVNRR